MSSLRAIHKEDDEVEADMRDFVETIWTATSKQISNNWLDSMQMPLAADMALLKLNRIVCIATTAYDGTVVNDETLENHLPDDEPVPVAIDPWARGTGN